MKKIRLLLVVLCALVFAACSSKKQDSPSSVVKEYLECIKGGNFDKAVKCFHFDTEVNEEELKAFAAKLETGYSREGKLLNYEIVSEEIEKDEDGNAIRGKVEVKLFYADDKVNEETIKTIKNNGAWKIDFSVK